MHKACCILDALGLTHEDVKQYQIRAKRLGRGRLVTGQAVAKNKNVLEEWRAAVAANVMVNDVFNLGVWVKSVTLDKWHTWFFIPV